MRPNILCNRIPSRTASFQRIAGTLLTTFFLVTTVGNLAPVYGLASHQKRSWMVLIVGEISGVGGFSLLPVRLPNDWSWVPLIADFGIPYGVGCIRFGTRWLVRKMNHAGR